jgi:IS30 family transposase
LRRRWPGRTSWHLCHETIYESVYSGLVVRPHEQTLRTGRTYRHKRGWGRNREGALTQSTTMKSIRQRPAVAEDRTQVGHWEGDLLIGAMQRSAIATLVERKTRHTILVPIRGEHSAQNVGDAVIDVFAGLPPALRRTLTWDLGQRDVPPRAHRTDQQDPDLLRRSTLALAARQQREHLLVQDGWVRAASTGAALVRAAG